MKLNIIIEVKDSRGKYAAEKQISPFKFVVVAVGQKCKVFAYVQWVI